MHSQFADLHEDTRAALSDLARDWADGLLSARSFADAMDEVLLQAHTAAVVIGRTHAGDDAPEEADDRRFAETVVEGEHEYLQAFREQMDAGRYLDAAGNRDAAAVARRAELYSAKIAATATEAWTLTLDPDTLITWHLGTSSEGSCSDCPELERRSPYLITGLPTVPLSGATLCRMSCRCWLSTEQGQTGFSLPN